MARFAKKLCSENDFFSRIGGSEGKIETSGFKIGATGANIGGSGVRIRASGAKIGGTVALGDVHMDRFWVLGVATSSSL